MKDILELNSEIEDFAIPKIIYNFSIRNYLFNKKWVNEIEPSEFIAKHEYINKLISELNFNTEQNIKFLKGINEIVISTINSITKNNNQFLEFDSSKWHHLSIENTSPKILPAHPCSEIDNTNKAYPQIISRIFNYFEIDKETQELFSTNSINNSNKELNEFILKKNNIDKEELEEYYAKSYMSYVLTLYQESLYKIADYILLIERTINMKGKPDEFHKINEHKTENIDVDKNVLKFNLSKNHIGHLFYNLYEIGIIAKDKTDIKDERTKLKNYIDSAKMFYLDKSSNYVRVERMTKAMKVDRNNSKSVQDEINFVESLVLKLNARLDNLNKKLENLESRGY